MTENEIRDYIFENHKETLHSLIAGEKIVKPISSQYTLPQLLKFLIESRINFYLNEIESLEITKKEVYLHRDDECDIRADLIGQSLDGHYAFSIVELKKSNQTARQAFTELLAYNNYFCRKYPSLDQKQILSILISPADKRTIIDAYIQELLFNEIPIILLEPEDPSFENSRKLKVIYPADEIYSEFGDYLLNDETFSTFVISFANIDGCIDTEETKERTPNSYSRDAMNGISSTIALELEKYHFHSIVYSRQIYNECADTCDSQNSFVVSILNPLKLPYYHKNRFKQEQQDSAAYNFNNQIYRLLIKLFKYTISNDIFFEISQVSWKEFKESPMEIWQYHLHNGYSTGLLRTILLEHMEISKKIGYDYANENDDVGGYSFQYLNCAFYMMNTINGLSQAKKDSCEDFINEVNEE